MEIFSVEITALKFALFIPSGVAHGFLSMEDESTVVYAQSTTYSKMYDDGIHWNSIGYDWKVSNPIISKRDNSLIDLANYDSPFK